MLRPLVPLALALLASACAASTTPRDDASTDAPAQDLGVSDSAANNSCNAATECAWGEIDHEILTRADCPCLAGCPGIALSRATVERRQRQYSALCTPGVDGMGRPCGVDDCIPPPPLECRAGVCLPPGG